MEGNIDTVPHILNKEVEKAIDNLKNNKAAGPDNIENRTLKILKNTVSPHLANIFNNILREKWIPSQWEEAEIILLFKKGEKENIGNYRPISLTSNISKLFSSIVKKQNIRHLDRN